MRRRRSRVPRRNYEMEQFLARLDAENKASEEDDRQANLFRVWLAGDDKELSWQLVLESVGCAELARWRKEIGR